MEGEPTTASGRSIRLAQPSCFRTRLIQLFARSDRVRTENSVSAVFVPDSAGRCAADALPVDASCSEHLCDDRLLGEETT
jgi:hypothetical protein